MQLASAREAIAYYRGVEDELNLLRALADAGNALYDLERYDAARVALEEALTIARRLGLCWDIADILRDLACCYPSGAGLKARRAYLTEALHVFKAIDAQVDIDAIAHDFADLAFDEGDPESAVTILTDLFARGYNRYSSRRFPVLDRLGLLSYLVSLGRYAEAKAYAREALGAARDQHLEVYTAEALAWLATIATLRAPRPTPDVHTSAARILSFVQARLKTLGSTARDRERILESRCEAIGTETVAERSADGANMTEDDAVELAETL